MSIELPVIIEVTPDQPELAAAAERLNNSVFGKPLEWNDGNRVFVAAEGDQVLGVTNININPDKRAANIRFMATDPSRQSRGIGSAMLNGALTAAEDAGCDTAWVTPFRPSSSPHDSDRLEEFYEKHGFVMPSPDLIGMMKTLYPTPPQERQGKFHA